MENTRITVEAIITKPLGQVWEKWTLPEHIMKRYVEKI